MPDLKNNGTLVTLALVGAAAVAGAAVQRRGSSTRGSAAGGKYGRFTRMPRREIQAYLQSWGYAVYDDESLDELRQTAFENEQAEGGAQPEPFYDPKHWTPGSGNRGSHSSRSGWGYDEQDWKVGMGQRQQAEQRLAQLEAELARRGGRGVELAQQIDELRAQLYGQDRFDPQQQQQGPPTQGDLESNAVISTPAWGAVTIAVEGRQIGTATDFDDALAKLGAWMKRQGYYPSIYVVNERGNIELVDPEGNTIQSWV